MLRTPSARARSRRTRGLAVAATLLASVARGSAASPSQSSEVAALVTAARGAPVPLCLLAAQALSNVGWRSSGVIAPRTPLGSAMPRSRVASDDASDDVNNRSRLSAADQSLLLGNLSAEDRCVRELSVRLLTNDRRRDDVGPLTDRLIERLASPDSAVREVASFGLGMLGRETAIPSLLLLLRDRSAGVRANASWALGRIGNGRALAGLMHASRDGDSQVREATMTALGQLNSAQAVPVLVRVLRQDDVASVRRVAAWALGRRHAEVVVSALSEALARDSDATVREMCAWALGELEAAGAIDDLSAAVRRDRATAVRESAVWALGEIEDARAAAALEIALTTDASLEVKRTAAWALGKLETRSAPKGLIAALTSPDDALRVNVSWALSEIHDPQSVAALKTAFGLETHRAARRAQLRGILAAGGGSEELLANLLRSSDPLVREAAVRGLAGGRVSDPWPRPWPRPRPLP